MATVARFDALRKLDYTGISGTYAAVGSAVTKRVRVVCFTNDTEGSVVFTNDVTEDQIFVKAGSFKLFDTTANINGKDDTFVFPIGTLFYVKQLGAPVSGSVYIEFLVDA